MGKRPKSSLADLGNLAFNISQNSKLKKLNESNLRLEKVQKEISNLSHAQLDVSNKILIQTELELLKLQTILS